MEQPTKDDWRAAIAAFRRYRAFDGKDFRHDVNKLLAALKREAEEAYTTAARLERRQSTELDRHDGAAIDGRLARYAEQLDLAGLDLLRLVPIEPWLDQADPYGVMPVKPHGLFVFGDLDDAQRVRLAQMAEQLQCWGLDPLARPIGQRAVRLVRLQAERLLEGADRVQHCVTHHQSRLKAIRQGKGYPSVALHDLFVTTEPWDVDAAEIARRLVKAEVLPPRAPRDATHDQLVARWHESLRRSRQDWRKEQEPKQRRRKK